MVRQRENEWRCKSKILTHTSIKNSNFLIVLRFSAAKHSFTGTVANCTDQQ